jgi:hypothetical protein
MSREIVQECYRRAAEAKRIADDASLRHPRRQILSKLSIDGYFWRAVTRQAEIKTATVVNGTR